MFRLKKLEIHGFKSFVDRTSLTLPSRLTAIVGPNGSGKSNICDAVMWVLGEQSARALRGTTMEDVIFNGSARRRPLGMAEVSLTLESRGGQWADTGGEVVLTRRVTRDGTSDYILNGRKARLKDIQDLLLGTGLGVRAYAIIEQQKIDLILSAKPQDRRRLIEEAAGISKYKIRKQQAEVKLEETRANLLRLTDIVSEIERACTSLKRQASRAARWKEQADVLSGLKKRLLRLKSERLVAATEAAEAALKSTTDAEGAALAESGRLDAAFEEARHAAEEAERLRRERADAFAAAREALLAAEAAVAAAAREAEETEARRELVGSQRTEAEEDHLSSVEEATKAEQLLAEAAEELAAAEARAKETGEALAAATRDESDATTRREGSRRELLAAAARATEATNREREAALLVDRLGFALTKVEERKGRAELQLQERRSALEAARDLEAETNERLAEARRRLEEAGVSRKSAEERLASLKEERERATRQFHALDKRLGALETLLAAREAGGEAARRALETSGAKADGVLADHFDAEEGFEHALDAALGGALEAPVVRDRAALASLIDTVRASHLGTARFVHPIPETPFPLKPADARVLGLARDLLTARPGDEGLSAALPDALVVASVDDALSLAELLPERTFVTKDGVVVRGSIVEAAGTEVPGEGLFTVRRDLKNVGAEKDALSERLDALEEEISGTGAQAGEAAQAVEREIAASRRAEREHSEALARLSAARDEATRAEREVATILEEEKQLRADLLRVGEERAKALELSAQKTGVMTAMEAAIAGLESGLESARAVRLSAQQADGEARAARDVLRERRRAAQEAFQTHRNRADAAARRLAELSQQITALGERKERALGAGEEARERREEAVVAASEAEAALKQADAAAVQRRGGLEELDRGAHAAREALDAARRARFEAELVVERRRGDREHLSETCRAEFGVPPEELPPVERAEGEPEPDDEALAAMQEEVVQKTVALERLGPVNHAALEEFDVESKRLQEMSTQKLDLEKSLDQILETIRTINLTSSERFTQAFVAINANFAQVFQKLFGGGTASMQLLDESDPLDSGIEIMAQPPGKRNQTIGLLSGGEKALTAVSLLVSIFRYKPSPFCILDEVDAPLDEANIDRFTTLLNELSEETQFVLITHSKRTMETAQALYGVTQEEPGVSKIVSVRFD
ncbi:MAG TPA: chromosome segregation protein SMC [Thermoanaerobaculia bacterium]|nr:chromosome segregation protein SMC [Thermoanaerobaculia bacterium]